MQNLFQVFVAVPEICGLVFLNKMAAAAILDFENMSCFSTG